MHGGSKAFFAQRCLNDNVAPINIQERITDTFVVDGAWLMRRTRWGKGFKWGDISGYVQFIKRQGHRATNLVVCLMVTKVPQKTIYIGIDKNSFVTK